MTSISIPNRKPIPSGQLLIDGVWRDATGGTVIPVYDPTTEEQITDVAKASAEDVQLAIDAAVKAFRTGLWPAMSHEDHAKLLFLDRRFLFIR